MEDKDIITGKLEDMESGEEWNAEFLLYYNDMELMTIVKVISADSYEDNFEKISVDVDCEAMDSLGFIYPIVLKFVLITDEENNKIMADMIPDALFFAKGRYGIAKSTLTIHLIDPEYIKVEADKDEGQIREAFQLNSKCLKKVQ
jgi:hypothetical protein